jgi:peptidoglycan/xylan/chitin deacetylase (PgdA/CDA1 family)
MKVIQTWDDGLVSDIRLIEILRRYQAKATFCLNPGLYQENRSFGWVHENKEVWRLSIHELVDVYHGFEICSHSMTHPYLTDLSIDQLQWELRTSRHILEDKFQKPVLGFCYPFNTYNDFVKDAVRSTGYKWARGNQHQGNTYPPIDLLEFHPCCHFLDQDFCGKYDRQKRKDSVFFFWGHSYELIDEAMWDNFEGMIEGISSDPDAEWFFVTDLFV